MSILQRVGTVNRVNSSFQEGGHSAKPTYDECTFPSLSFGSTFVHFRGIRSNFSFLFHFSVIIKITNRIAPDGTPRFAPSHLGLFCLPMSHKKNARLLIIG